MNTGLISRECNDEVDNVSNYEERMKAYFIVNDITEEKNKMAIVITVIGSKTYN